MSDRPFIEDELVSRSPADLRDVVGTFPYSLDRAEEAVGEARAAQPAWAHRRLEERLNLLAALRERFLANAGEFTTLLCREVGKPRWEAAQEAALLPAKIDSFLAEGLPLVRTHVPAGVTGEWRFRPHGVMAVIGPFNFPVHLPNGHIVPALALGNTVVFKPSELTPALGALYERCVQEAGFPMGVFSVIQGDRSIGAYLSQEADVDGILFTGSVATGIAIARANADRPGKILALELGGKNAALVFDDSDVDQALQQVAYGGFITTGQRCSSTSRCLVQRGLLPRFSQALADLARKISVGHYAEPVFMGPLISAPARERYLATLKRAPQEGAEVMLESIVPDTTAPGHYVGPSVHLIQTPHADSRYQTDELFGPDIAVRGFDDDDDALAIANETAFGLVASVFTSKKERFEWLAERLRAGVINWNAPTVGASGKLPFGGIGLSGNHRPAGAFSSLYCAWPVALLEGAPLATGKPGEPGRTGSLAPGFPEVHGS
jgi:succinylglutamic semialdehyde dehydrogenase